MSLEGAKAFMERIKTDDEFGKKFAECKDHELRMTFVKQAGYDFTGDDLELAMVEISESDLNGISGGRNKQDVIKMITNVYGGNGQGNCSGAKECLTKILGAGWF